MGNPVVHFEIAGPDGPALRQFYRDLFGWEIQVQGEEMHNYGLVSANEGGIGGGLFPTAEGTPARSYVTFYVQVDDIQVALDRAAGMGGKAIVPPMEIAPGMGSIAMFEDPAGIPLVCIRYRRNGTDRCRPRGMVRRWCISSWEAAMRRSLSSSMPECSTGRSTFTRRPTTASSSRNPEGLAGVSSST